MDMQFPLHYYVRFLHYGIRCLEELSYDLPFGQSGAVSAFSPAATVSNVKSVELDVTSYKRTIIPGDCVDIVDVQAKYSEHLLPLRRDQNLSLIQNYDDQGNKIPIPNTKAENTDDGKIPLDGLQIGTEYGAVDPQNQSYNVDSELAELVFNNHVKTKKIVLTYLTKGVTNSGANVVHPYAQDTIIKYILYQKHLHTNNSFNKTGVFKNDYINSKRKLRSRLNAMTYADIIAVLRQGLHAGLKN